MSHKAHIFVSGDGPLNFALKPPELFVLCQQMIPNARPVFMVEAVEMGLPDLSGFRWCRPCVEALEAESRKVEGEQYIYGVMAAQEAFDVSRDARRFDVFGADDLPEQQHAGETINELEKTVSRVGVNHLPLKQQKQ